MKLPESEYEYRQALHKVAVTAAIHALKLAGVTRTFLKLKEAERTYGAENVRYWIASGYITPRKDGSAKNAMVRLDLETLEMLSNTSNRAGKPAINAKRVKQITNP